MCDSKRDKVVNSDDGKLYVLINGEITEYWPTLKTIEQRKVDALENIASAFILIAEKMQDWRVESES